MLEESEYFGLLAPEFGVEVEAYEFDGFAEALAWRDACFAVLVVLGLAGPSTGLRMELRTFSIRHVYPIDGLRVPVLLPVIFGFFYWFLGSGCYGLVRLVKGSVALTRFFPVLPSNGHESHHWSLLVGAEK